MYALILSFMLGYCQLLVLDESLTVLLDVSWYCSNCTLSTVEQHKWSWWRGPSGVPSGSCFYGLAAVSVHQPTVLKNWRKWLKTNW